MIQPPDAIQQDVRSRAVEPGFHDVALGRRDDHGFHPRFPFEIAQVGPDAISGNEKKVRASSGFLRGQVMKLSGGKADPKLTGELIEATLLKLKV